MTPIRNIKKQALPYSAGKCPHTSKFGTPPVKNGRTKKHSSFYGLSGTNINREDAKNAKRV
jgi:hypothetical protein